MSITQFQTTTNSGLLLKLVAGTDGGNVTGYFSVGGYGSLTPDIYRGEFIERISTATLSLTIQVPTVALGQNWFATVMIPGIGLFSSADASYFDDLGGRSSWQWTAIPANFVNGQSYGVIIS